MIETQTQHTHNDKTITLNVTERLPIITSPAPRDKEADVQSKQDSTEKTERPFTLEEISIPGLDAEIVATEVAIRALRDKYKDDPFSDSADFLDAKKNVSSLTNDLNILKKRKEDLELQQKADTPEKRIQGNKTLLRLTITRGLSENIPQDIRNDAKLIAHYITGRLVDDIAKMIENNQLQGPNYATILATTPYKNLRAPVTIKMTSENPNKADETKQVAKAAYTTEQKKENPDDQATLLNEYTAFLDKSNLERLVISLRLKLQRNEAEYARHLEGKKVYEAKATKKGGTDLRDLSEFSVSKAPERKQADAAGNKHEENNLTDNVAHIWLNNEEYLNLGGALNIDDVDVGRLSTDKQELLFRVIEIERALNPVVDSSRLQESLIDAIDSRINLPNEKKKKIHDDTAKKFTDRTFTDAFNDDKKIREQYQAIIKRIRENIH